ncbi:hypothetical protein M2325_000730 [Methanococcus voltae PS]|uniref:ASCH domain-containing protein n=1 Tax=Methanococcus voltae PS TaxID=523842 RepID=A0ABT2EYM5_METVO|nr:hypothetical protein [Methanococcus voltae]MCS3922045.1 hypothetical protein [Methanococcus voltae PS]
MSNWFKLEKGSTQYATAKEYLQIKGNIEEKACEYTEKYIETDGAWYYKTWGLALWITGVCAEETPANHILVDGEYRPVEGTDCYNEFEEIPSISIEKMHEIQDGLNISKHVVYKPGFKQKEDEIYIKIDPQYLASKDGYENITE